METRLTDGTTGAGVAAGEREGRFGLLFEHSPLPMWVYDLDTLAFLAVNDAAVAGYGYSREEFLGMRITDIRPEEDVPALLADVRAARPPLQHRTPSRHRRKDGTLLDVEVTSHTLPFQGRRAALVVALDVTHQKRSEERLREQEARYRTVVTNAPVILFALDAEGVFTLSEGRGLARLGLEPGEVVGRSIFDLYAAHPGVLERVREGLAGAAATWTVDLDGARFDTHTAPAYDEHGRAAGLIGVATDVTERYEAQQERLRLLAQEQEARRAAVESRQRLEFLYRTMGALLSDVLDYPKSLRRLAEAVVPALADWCVLHVVGEDGAVERLAVVHADPSKAASVSGLFRQLGGAQLGGAPGAGVGPGRVLRTGEPELYPEVPDRLLAELARDGEQLRRLRGLGLVSGLVVPLVARGRTLGVLTLATAESGRRYGPEDLALAEDLAHRAGLVVDSARLYEAAQRANAELERRVLERTAQLEAANQELESFSYSVSHDLRSPLRAIEGFTRILVEDHAGELGPKAQGYLERVRRNALRMGTLIDDLLQFSRLSRKELQKQEVEPAALVHQVLEELDPAAEGRDVRVDVGDLPACDADPAMLKQVYANLLSNALKFSQYRSPAVVRVAAERRGGDVVYSVSDNGAGFDMRYADKLFGVFQRLHRAEEYEGTGVGLAIVQRIIHRHGGEVWAASAPDEGATFYFTLPRATPPPTSNPARA